MSKSAKVGRAASNFLLFTMMSNKKLLAALPIFAFSVLTLLAAVTRTVMQ